MSKTKLATPMAKSNSSYQKKVNELRKQADDYRKANDKREEQIRRTQSLILKLLNEGRITKDELKEYFPPKKPR